MTEQLTLTPWHRGDPPESRQAASKVRAESQRQLVLRCLLAAEAPLTDDEIGEWCGIPARPDAGTRRGVLVKQGLVEKAGTGFTARGNQCSAWRLTAAGEQVATHLRGGE